VRLVHAVLAAGLSALLATPSAPALDAAGVIGCEASAGSVEIPPDETVRLDLAATVPPNGYLRIEESGHELEYTTDDGANWLPVGSRPPRLGIEYAVVRAGDALRVRAMSATSAPARVSYVLICEPDDASIAAAACTRKARIAQTTGDVTSAAAPASPSECTALILHAGAAWSSGKNRPQESISRYVAATAAWAAAGDAGREAASWLGRAEQHWRVGAFAEAVDAATQAERLANAADQPYFATRARMERCLALNALGDAAAADPCFDGLPERYVTLGELNDAANAWASMATRASEHGDVLAAERHIASALAIDPARLSALTTGRLRLVESWVATRRGRFDAALVAIDASLTAFDRIGDRRGRANAQLAAASIMLVLDAWTDAWELATEAHETYVAIDAPARTAVALALLARIAQARGDADAAVALSVQAAELLNAQNARWRSLKASLVAVALGDARTGAALKRALDDVEMPVGMRNGALLALADAALVRRELAEVRSLSSQLDPAVLDPLQRHHRERITAALLIGERRAAQAIAGLDAAIERVHQEAVVLPSALLRFALGARLAELRAAWVDAWIAMPADARPDAGAVWRMQVRTGREALLSPKSQAIKLPADALARFEAITARAMVPADDEVEAADGGQRALLAYQAALGANNAANEDDWLSLAELQTSLSDGERVLTLATGATAALRIDITREHAVVVALPYGSEQRAALSALGAWVLQPTSALAEIEAAATAVSRWLFTDISGERPARLLVHADALRTIGALGLLRWPGNAAMLVDETRVSWLASGRRGGGPAARVAAVDIFVAPSVGDSDAARSLGELANAEVEADWIRSALAGATVSARSGTDFTRDALAAALARDGARVHIATHGRTRRGLLGQSGLLLPRAQSGELAFVSWIGLADQPIRADLLVLNACDLADGPGSGAVRQAAFANALAASGARNTVAALWPVSDGAAAVWVPAFYRALAERPDDPAQALQQAQAALRASRMYRHPHYWSALVHLTTVHPSETRASDQP
jgi:tetratricopeptide (TPR) repeat protein